MGFLGSIAGSIVSGFIGRKNSKSNATDAYERQKEMMQNAHQWEVEDLKKAGLNPILSSGGSGAGSYSAPMATDNTPDFAAAATAKKQAELQERSIGNDEKQTDSNVKLQDTQADKNKADTDLSISNQKLASAQEQRQRTENEVFLKYAPLEYESRINNNNAQALAASVTSSAAAANSYAQAGLAASNTRLSDRDYNSANFYAKNGTAGLVAGIYDSIFGNNAKSNFRKDKYDYNELKGDY